MISIFLLLAIAASLLFFLPQYYRLHSYERFYRRVVSLRNFKSSSFEIEPLQPLLGGYGCIFTEIDLSKIRDINVSEMSNKSLEKYCVSTFVPLSYFGKIDAKKYFFQKYNLSTVGLNGTKGFSSMFFERFYNPSEHILAMVFLQYVPGIRGNRFITSITPLDFVINGIEDTPQNKLFRNEIMKHLGTITTTVSTDVSVYSSDNLIATIYIIAPKKDYKSVSLTALPSVLNLLKNIEKIITQ